MVGVGPGAMISLHVLNLSEFKIWINSLHCFTMATILIVVALMEDIIQVLRQYRKKKNIVKHTTIEV